jgi:lipopolysaccharide transport system ATP-binding protein
VGFQKKCQERLEAIRDSGTPILFVSHNMIAVQRLCSRCMLLEQGNVVYSGNTDEAVSRYYQSMMDTSGSPRKASRGSEKITHRDVGSMDIYVADVSIEGREGQPLERIPCGSFVRFVITLVTRNSTPERLPIVFIRIGDPKTNTPLAYIQIPASLLNVSGVRQRFELTCDVASFNLAPGSYELLIKVGGASTDPLYDIAVLAAPLQVTWTAETAEVTPMGVKLCLPAKWSLREGQRQSPSGLRSGASRSLDGNQT